MKKSLIWLVGASNMAEDYARVLIAQKKNFEVIGRGKKSALKFYKNIGKLVKTGGLNINLKKYIHLIKIPLKKVTNELNHQIVDKNRLSRIKLKNKDKIEIVHFIGGG